MIPKDDPQTLLTGSYFLGFIFPIVCLQAACLMAKNILMALSLLMAATPVVCVTVMEERLSAPRSPVMESAATLTSHQDNVVENVNVCKGKAKLCLFPHVGF